MNLKEKAKNKLKSKIRKVAFKVIKPFLPFLIIIVGLFFAFCMIIDAVFVQEVQTDNASMSQAQVEIKNKCIAKAEYLNTCHNYKENELTKYLLDIDNRENDKEIQWSHLYSIMAFHNMTDNKEINENLLNEVAKSFESTFKYERMTIETKTKEKDNKGKEKIITKKENAYILVESDTIIGHFKYYHEEISIQEGNTTTTKKVFKNEELIGEKYERLRRYLKEKLNIKEDDLETDIEIVVQAANRIL